MFWTKGYGAGIKVRQLLAHGKGGGDDKVERLRKENLEDLRFLLPLPPQEEDKQELQQVLQQGSPTSGSAPSLLNPTPPSFPNKNRLWAQPASCPQQSAAHDNSPFCLYLGPVLPVHALVNPQTPERRTSSSCQGAVPALAGKPCLKNLNLLLQN